MDSCCARIHCRAKPKGSIYLLYKLADTAFWLCRATHIHVDMRDPRGELISAAQTVQCLSLAPVN